MSKFKLFDLDFSISNYTVVVEMRGATKCRVEIYSAQYLNKLETGFDILEVSLHPMYSKIYRMDESDLKLFLAQITEEYISGDLQNPFQNPVEILEILRDEDCDETEEE
jgi:hypothetical protein